MTNLDVANRFFNALLAGDGAALDGVFSQDAIFWTNFSGKEQHRREFIPRFAALASTMPGLHFENVRRTATPAGFVEQHTLCGETPDGGKLAAHGCFIVTVVDGRITRLNEYIDSGQLAPLTRRRAS